MNDANTCLADPNERLDEVNDDLSLIQRTDGLAFGTDALLLAAYLSSAGKFRTGLEIGGGTGIISLLLLSRGRIGEATSVEVQEEYARLTERNAERNGLADRLRSVCADVRDFRPGRTYDAVYTNPPYLKTTSGDPCVSDKREIARHEVFGTLFELLAAAGRLLRYGGTFAAVFLPERLADLIEGMRRAGIEPKRATFVHSNAQSAPSSVLVLGRRGGKAALSVTAPLLLYREEENKKYTEDMELILTHGRMPDRFGQKGARYAKRGKE